MNRGARYQALQEGRLEYNVGVSCKRGHVTGRYASSGQCIACARDQSDNYDKLESRKSYKISRYAKKTPAAKLLQGARYRGKEFSLTEAYIIIPEVCPCCGVKLVQNKGRGKSCKASATLDRVDNDKGYIPGNVWVICYRCNSIKRDATPNEIMAIACAVENFLLTNRKD